MIFKAEALIQKALTLLDLPSDNLSISITNDSSFGDYSTNIAMQLAKIQKKQPRILAQEIIDAIPENTIFEKIEIAGPGFLNFFCSPDFIKKEFLEFSPQKPPVVLSKNICVEFSSPNVAKPLHFGHLRTTIIGDSLARIFEFLGYSVIRENFLGDWGTGFGKLVIAIERWGDMAIIEKNPIQELVTLYKKFIEEAEKNPSLDDEAREAFRKLEMENNLEIRSKWEWIRDVSMRQVQDFYNFLDIRFDWILGESFYAQFNEKTLKKIEQIGEISEGALVVKFPDISKDGEGKDRLPLILFRRADGATLYQTRDVSHLMYLQEKGIDEFITVVANEQSLHFSQIFDTVKRLGNTMKCEHVSFGMVLGEDGKKFSTRKGNGVGLDDVFDEAKEKVKTIISERVSEFTEEEKDLLIKQISVGAIKFNDLCQNRLTDIVFNWEKILSFDGYSGPFLQYSYARAKSILRKENSKAFTPDYFQLVDIQEERSLIKKISEFHYILKIAGDTRRPNILAEYLFQLAKEFNAFYQNTPILKENSDDKKYFRLLLVEKFSSSLSLGLSLLGIEAPEKM